MQTSELEQIKNHLLGDKECINFRPSPNFKHMKKYLKSKFEEANSSPNQSSDPSTTPNSEEHETVQTWQVSSSTMAQKSQPPLPPNSPPPRFLVVPKEEVVDEGYKDNPSTQLQFKKDNVQPPVVKKPEKIMCRQFARSMCNRGATCIYVHELILSQLPGVYTFCKNFQNSICNFPKCKFVHATVFEKEHFYRTGYLPPHTLAHLKETNSALGPPHVVQGAPAEAAKAFSNPSSSVHPSVNSLPTNGCPPTESPARGAVGDIPKALRFILKQGVKFDKEELDLVPDVENGDSRCKTCKSSLLRLQCTKANLEVSQNQTKFIANQRKQVKMWMFRLKMVFDTLAKSGSGSGFSFSELVSSRRKKEKTKELTMEQVDQIQMLLQVTGGSSSTNKMLMNQILNVLKKKPTDFKRAISNALGR